MNSGLNVNDPVVVEAFKTLLLRQGWIALLIFATLLVTWLGVRMIVPAAARNSVMPGPAAAGASGPAEPAGRQVLRIGFGLLWLVDGILQAQPKMAIGLPSQVIQPVAAASPRWVQQVANWAGTTWSYHPIQAGASAVWIQVGIGIWMIAATRGTLSRLAGLVSAGWGLVVWVFGESFGGIFAPGLTWLFGAPGAVLIYVVAGALIALPQRAWRGRRLGRLLLAGTGLFLAGMAVLQAWPGRGFWQGTWNGRPGTLAGMTQAMATTPQPHILSTWISAFTSFDEGHGFAVNLFVVAALALVAVAFLSGRPRLIRAAFIAFAILCLADWVLIEDFGFFGGLGTDPNSMIPMILVAAAGYLAVTSPGLAAEPTSDTDSSSRRRDLLRPQVAVTSLAGASLRSVASAAAIGVIILGAAPMEAAQANPAADTILAQAIDGSSAPVNYPAPAFSLTDQYRHTVTLGSLHGKVILLTFLDPVCSVDCPLIAQEFRLAGQLLSADSRQVELLAINYNPLYTQVGYVRAFDRQEHLAGLPNWQYLTGPRPALQQIWRRYGLPEQVLPAGSMIAHGDYVFVIDQAGHVRRELDFNPGPGTSSTKSSFAAELAGAARQLLRPQ